MGSARSAANALERVIDPSGGRKVFVFSLNLNTNQANLASDASGRQVLVFFSNLNTDQANLASEASVQQVLVFILNLNTNR